MKRKEWYLGLDISSSSIGWAATDSNYKLLRKNKKRLWGVRLFEEAKSSFERRTFRSERRRLARRKWRINLLEELFIKEVSKKDPNFFLRLKESKYRFEDKSLMNDYILFNDKDYTDKDYYKEYPTIYHLRSSLMTEKNPDIRKIYLAIHSILKNRGHFLLQGQSFSDSNIDSVIKELLELNIVNIEFEVTDEVIYSLKEIALQKKNLSDKNNDVKKLYPKEKQLQEIFKLIFGGKTSLDKIYEMEEYKELDASVKSISFKEKVYEEVRPDYEQILSNYIELLDLAKLVYDNIVLAEIKKEGKTISESKVELYNKHKKDLENLKNLVKADNKLSEDKKKEVYNEIFKVDIDKGTNYVNYAHKSKNGKSCSYEDFKKFLKKELEKLQDSEIKNKILEELDLETFLPLQRTKDNSVVPYQIHKEELVKILDNAAKYHSFLNEKDNSGYSIREKVIQLLEFRIPYYIGPLNTHHNIENGGYSWAIRKEGMKGVAVTPWNFRDIIDESASAEAFINNLTNKCTYLAGEDVLPKNSLLYSEYALLNELNALKYEGDRISVEARDIIVRKLFKEQGKKVTKKTIKELLKTEGFIDGKGEIAGIDNIVKNDLKSYRDFKKILGDKFDKERVENIILWITLYGESRKLIKEKITKVYGDFYTVDEIEKMSRLTYKDWGTLSRKLLTELVSEKLYNEETGECLNIIGAMRQGTILFMELLADKFDYMNQIKSYNKENKDEIMEITPDILENLYASPAVKRSIWQTVRIVEELKSIIGCAPIKIFVETTRRNNAPNKVPILNRNDLVIKYKTIKDQEILELEKELNSTLDFSINKDKLINEEPSKLKATKLYLYYTQLGRCMYTNKKIDLGELFDNNKYDIDHIYPQRKVKDGSFSNIVLVTKASNEVKADVFPLKRKFQTEENKIFWRFLKEKKLITEEKYNRLVRTEEFSDDELTGFIARQLVETSQAIKVSSYILGELNPETTICYSKAENVNSFRQSFGKIKDGDRKSTNIKKLIRVQEINDYHRAKDAYLNIVVGNVYDVKFTRNVCNFIKNKKDARKYSLNTLFYTDVKNANTVAWEVDKTIHIVEKTMNNNNILVTRRTAKQKGALYDATVYKAKIAEKAKEGAYYPLKTTDDKIKNVNKYGGFTKVKIAYYSIFEYTLNDKKGEKKITRILPVPIYIAQNIKDDRTLLEYAQTQLPGRNLELKYRKLCIGNQIKINNFNYYMGGKTNDNFFYDSAVQVVLDKESELYIKELAKYLNWKKENKEGVLWESIIKDKNIQLYNTLVEKMNTGLFIRKTPNKYNELSTVEVREKFNSITEDEQAKVLLEVLNLLTNKKSTSNLNIIGIIASRGVCNFNLSNQSQFSIIEKSVTGVFEKEIEIISE